VGDPTYGSDFPLHLKSAPSTLTPAPSLPNS
jgi:hypothetical protein